MRLHEVEPAFGPGEVWSVRALGDHLMRRGRRSGDGPFLLAVDGRSSNGKSTLARRIADQVPDTDVVHTDDIAWWHSRFGWEDLLITGVIEPLRRGDAVRYRPPAWDQRSREGFVTARAGLDLVVIEGVGAGRASLAELVDAVIWVQSDLDVTRLRDEERIAGGETDREGCDGWMAEEVPFQARERTWERADVVVCGSCPVSDPGSEVVVLRAGLSGAGDVRGC